MSDRILEPGTPLVWLFDVDAPWFVALSEDPIVSDQERARAATLTDPKAARALLARRTALRCVLATRLGLDPEDVRVVTAPGGKPVLVPPAGRRALAFSVAHSGDLYGIALSASASVGLDLERRREIPRALQIAHRWFGAAEAAVLDGLADDALLDEFLRLWTGKEALAKRHGAGLRLMRGDEGELDVDAALRDGRLRYFESDDAYASAVASTEVVREVRVVRPTSARWDL